MIDKITNIIKQETFTGEDGLDYITVTKEILTPRKTYLKGTITGKYRGNKIPDDYYKSDLFDFEIYEAEVLCNSIDDFSKNRPFVFPNDFKNIESENRIKGRIFPKHKLPTTLPVIITANNKTFGINVLEPKLFEFESDRKYHQTDGDEVFGTFSAYVTGYVFDYEREEVEEIVGPVIEEELITQPPSKKPIFSLCEPSSIETGKSEIKGNYLRKEYLCKNHNDRIWGKWENNGIKSGSPDVPKRGCISEIFSIIGILLFLAFLISVLPAIGYFILFYIIILVIGLLAPFLKWIFRGIAIFLLIGFIGSIINSFNHRTNHYTPPIVSDNVREKQQTTEPIIEKNKKEKTDFESKPNDYLIKRFREWKDYDGKIFKGYYTLKKSDIDNASSFKKNLPLTPTSNQTYDEIIFRLKNNDRTKLDGLYKLFDSIQGENKLSKVKFAQMIVSFVQDIPYVLILEDDCNPNLYNDNFTRRYLSSPNAKCSGYQKYGINTPVEFLSTLEGDCDTRTLLIYTVLSHYNYDVAVMSSQFYSHSIIGINLSIEGTAYTYNNDKYVLWETTTANSKPGQISDQISNLNNWRISLKSK